MCTVYILLTCPLCACLIYERAGCHELSSSVSSGFLKSLHDGNVCIHILNFCLDPHPAEFLEEKLVKILTITYKWK